MRSDHPLRRVAQRVDFTFVRQEVEEFYGRNGNVSIEPVVALFNGCPFRHKFS